MIGAPQIVECIAELKKDFPHLEAVLSANYPATAAEMNFDAEVEYFKVHVQPHCMDLLKKNEDLFKEPRHFLRGVDFSELIKDAGSKVQEKIWTYSRLFLLVSYLGADIMGTIKTVWSSVTGKTETDDIDEILKDESTQSGVEELFEVFKNTRIFKIGLEVAESLDVRQLGLDQIDFTDIPALLEMVKNPEHPVTKRAIMTVQNLIEHKMRTGSLRKEDFIGEIEMLKAKFKSSLGKLFSAELFGDASDRPARSALDLTSNHPEARRARMLARLQERQKKGKK
jgi:hypothetical protein